MSQPELQAFLPRALLPSASNLLEHHALVVEQVSSLPRVRAIVPQAELPASMPQHRFAEEVWTVAPVLAHAHLESWDAPAEQWQRGSFTEWVQELMAWRGQDRLDAQESARQSLQALGQSGASCVAAHVGEPFDLAGALAMTPGAPRVLAWQEWIGAGELSEPWPGLHGFALHAPYSVPLPQAQALLARSQSRGEVLSLHLGEHAEEREFLASATGPMADMVQARQGSLPATRFASPVDWLEAAGGMRPGVLAVHGGDLSAEELQRLQGAGVSLVYCPGTHEYFARDRPAFVEAGGLPPALGCDSMASNRCLDPLYELRLACQQMPEFGPQAWWAALTAGGAEALHQVDLGHWKPGAEARVLRLSQVPSSATASAAELCAYLASGEATRIAEGSLPPC